MNKRIKESFSEKEKRGRPKSKGRLRMEEYQSYMSAAEQQLSQRSKMNIYYESILAGAMGTCDVELQKAIFGCTAKEVWSGDKKPPRGWRTAALEAGRYVDSMDVDSQHVLRIIADARKDGISFSDIAAHFRRLRLGEKQGSSRSLCLKLARAVDEYARTYPGTTNQQFVDAVDALKKIVTNSQGDQEQCN